MRQTLPQRAALCSTLLVVGIGAALAAWGAAFLALTFFSTLPYARGVERHWPDVGLFYCAAALASLLLSPLFWWRFIIRPAHLTLGRGILVGMLVSLVAHPLTWFLAMATASFIGRQTVLLLLIPSSNPLLQLLESLVISLWSLLYVGWITMLVGGLVGGLLALLQRTFMVRLARSQNS